MREGSTPTGQVAQGRDGWLYGTTLNGSCATKACYGVAFKIKPDGTSFSVIHKFALTHSQTGRVPAGGLVLGKDGNFYGTTLFGGPKGAGTIFKMTPAGATTALFAFSSVNEATYPPIQAPDGNLYGTTRTGGNLGLGMVYKFNLSTKAFTILHHFSGRVVDGSQPRAPLLFARDGNLYGTTVGGGTNNVGTVFRIKPNGTSYNIIYHFSTPKGTEPLDLLAQGNDGNFYGTTWRGGTHASGTVYKLTPQGAFTALHNFNLSNAFSSGGRPATGLILGSDGSFYGATESGGIKKTNNCGVLFKTSPLGAYSVLYRMNTLADGCFEGMQRWHSSLTLHTNGQFYGVASLFGPSSVAGQSDGAGTVFRLGNSLPAFIKPDTDAAKVGATIGLLGEFSGVTKVTFNGINASFTKVSSTFITAKVPVDAKTGAIVVNKGTTQVKSLKNFVVLP